MKNKILPHIKIKLIGKENKRKQIQKEGKEKLGTGRHEFIQLHYKILPLLQPEFAAIISNNNNTATSSTENSDKKNVHSYIGKIFNSNIWTSYSIIWEPY